jgi:hypothetical protein
VSPAECRLPQQERFVGCDSAADKARRAIKRIWVPRRLNPIHFGAVHEMSEKVTIPRLNRDLLPVAPHEDPAAEIAGDRDHPHVEFVLRHHVGVAAAG